MRGRKERTAQKRALIIEALASGASFTRAARHAGMARSVLFDWKAKDPEFRHAVEEAFQDASDRLEDAAWKRAFSSENDVLLIFLLKQRDPARFNRRMVDVRVTGDPNNPVTVGHTPGTGHRARLVILPNDNDDEQTRQVSVDTLTGSTD